MVSAPPCLHDAQTALGIEFADDALLRLALTHPSYTNEHEGSDRSFDRLEFLGDSVLGMVIAERLYERFPEVEEGRLTLWRAHIVQGSTLAEAAKRLGLGRYLLLGRGEETTGGRDRPGNLADAYEALIGALKLDRGPDGGLEGARRFIERTLAPELEALQTDPAELNTKGALQQYCEGRFGRPHYVIVEELGPEHDREFAVEVRVDGEVMGRGSGRTKQQAEKDAAREALRELRMRAAGTD
ncbi:MAG: ribonuclease III [Chloroflexi bacterium]|nr:ribonuclease III [Chloroflexota bacterium]